MHSLLRRQVKRSLAGEIGPDLQPFVDAVDTAYRQFDNDRQMLERSLDLSSQELLQANAELTALLRAFPDLFLRIDADGVVRDVKKCGMLSFLEGRGELVGRRIQDLGLGQLSEGFEQARLALVGADEPVSLIFSMPPMRPIEWFESRLIQSPAGELIVIVRNVTQRHRAEEENRQSVSLLHSTLESTADGILVVNLQGGVVLHNKRFVELWEVPPGLLATGNYARIADYLSRKLEHSDQFLRRARQLLAQPDAGSTDRLQLSDGRELECLSVPQVLDGRPVGRVWSFRDVTAQKQAEEALIHDALHDALTGLPNRALLMDRLGQALDRAKRDAKGFPAVLFIEIDRFKLINDSLGHVAGDELLAGLATRLQTCAHLGDTVARLSGDEFAILLDSVDDETGAIAIAEHVQSVIAKPFELRSFQVNVTASIGIAVGARDHEEAQELLRGADIAMYVAKSRGGAGHQMFQPGMRSRAVARLELESDLRRAIEGDQLLLHYQPIYELDHRSLVGFEALVRWHHPEKGVLTPADFIPLAEETGLILQIGGWVLAEACRQMAAWRRDLPAAAGKRMSVNVSARQLAEDRLPAFVQRVLRSSSLAPECLALEVTETQLMERSGISAEVLERLHALGTPIHLDDFGIGFSSLDYLHRLPIDALKIDRSFVARLNRPGSRREIVRTITDLARSLSIEVIAEGVETSEQAAQLIAMGCRFGQGYHFSRPLSADAAAALMAQADEDRAAPHREMPKQSMLLRTA